MDYGDLEMRFVPDFVERTTGREPGSFLEYVEGLPYHVQRMMGALKLPFDEAEGLAEAMKKGEVTVYYVSDGSVRNGQAAYAWVIEAGAEHRVDGARPCNGDPEELDSFRAEYMGLLGIAYFIRAMQEYCSFRLRRRPKLRCNNKAVIRRASKRGPRHEVNATMRPSYDIDKWRRRSVTYLILNI